MVLGLGKWALRSFAPLQLALRVDCHRKMLVYDYFAWKPSVVDFSSDKSLPTNGQYLKMLKSEDFFSDGEEPDDSDSKDEERQKYLNEVIKSNNPLTELTEEDRQLLHMKCIAAEFYDTRVMRYRICLSQVII